MGIKRLSSSIAEVLPLKKKKVSHKLNGKRHRAPELANPSKRTRHLEFQGVPLKFDQPIGQGGFGQVFLERVKDVTYAVKRTDKESFNPLESRKFNHPNVMHVYETLKDEKNVFIVSELYDENLESKFQDRNMTEDEAKEFASQLLEALNYLNFQEGISHCDIKPANVCYSSTDGKFKLIDFGLSQGIHSIRPGSGTPVFMSPESKDINRRLCTPAVDYWSLGKTIIYLMSKQFSIQHLQVSEECLEFLRKLLKEDPETRLSGEEALVHPWIAGSSSSLWNQFWNWIKSLFN